MRPRCCSSARFRVLDHCLEAVCTDVAQLQSEPQRQTGAHSKNCPARSLQRRPGASAPSHSDTPRYRLYHRAEAAAGGGAKTRWCDASRRRKHAVPVLVLISLPPDGAVVAGGAAGRACAGSLAVRRRCPRCGAQTGVDVECECIGQEHAPQKNRHNKTSVGVLLPRFPRVHRPIVFTVALRRRSLRSLRQRMLHLTLHHSELTLLATDGLLGLFQGPRKGIVDIKNCAQRREVNATSSRKPKGTRGANTP